MDNVLCLERLSSVYYHLLFGFFALGNFKEMTEILGAFLVLAFGFKSLCSVWLPTQSNPIPRDSKLKQGKSRTRTLFDAKLNRKLDSRVNCGWDVRKLIKVERRRADEAWAEVERERAAAATAVEEAMAMIQRLQLEKSSMEMEFNQHRRLCEARKLHDEDAIESLELLLQTFHAELSDFSLDFSPIL